jgi:hypothetical protein
VPDTSGDKSGASAGIVNDVTESVACVALPNAVFAGCTYTTASSQYNRNSIANGEGVGRMLQSNDACLTG